MFDPTVKPKATRTTRPGGTAPSPPDPLVDPLHASARIAPPATRTPAPPTQHRTGLTGPGFRLPETSPVSRANAHQYGLTQREFAAMQTVTRQQQLDLSVRTGHPSRTQHVGEKGSRPKPAGLYEKTSKSDDHPGLVLPPIKGACSDDRFRAEPGSPLRDASGNSVHGDIDLKSVARNGKRLQPMEYVPMLNAALDRGSERERPAPTRGETSKSGLPPKMVQTGSKIQHGAHDDWDRRNDMTYDGGRNAGPIPGVLHMQPGHPNQVMHTTAAYRQHLDRQGRGDTYTEAAWKRGQDRDKAQAQSDGIATVKKLT